MKGEAVQHIRLGKYLTLEEFCTCTQTFRKYADQIDPYSKNREARCKKLTSAVAVRRAFPALGRRPSSGQGIG